MSNKPEYLIIHCEAASNGFDIINEDHKARGFIKSFFGNIAIKK